jgi:hypothetical protein
MASNQEQEKTQETQTQETQTQTQETQIPKQKPIEFKFPHCSVNVPYSIVMKSKFISDMVEDIGIECIEDGKLYIEYDSKKLNKEELELYFYLVEIYYTLGYDVLSHNIGQLIISPKLLCKFINFSDYLNITLFIDALCEYTASIL